MRLKADLVLVLVAVMWGSAFAAQRAAGLLGSVYFFNASRFLVAALLLAPLAVRTRTTPAQLLWTCIAGTVLFLASALQQAGLRTTTAGNAGFLTSLYVVIVPLIMLLGWGDRPSALSLLSVLLAALGAYLLSTGGDFRVLQGDLMELGGAVFWAVHVVIVGKFAAQFDAVSFSAGQLLVASGLNWLGAGAVESLPLPLSPVLVISILYTAIVSLGLGYTLQIWAQKHAPPTDAAIILSMESVFAAIGGAAFLQEQLSQLQIAGCVAIVVAVILSQLRPSSTIEPTRPGE